MPFRPGSPQTIVTFFVCLVAGADGQGLAKSIPSVVRRLTSLPSQVDTLLVDIFAELIYERQRKAGRNQTSDGRWHAKLRKFQQQGVAAAKGGIYVDIATDAAALQKNGGMKGLLEHLRRIGLREVSIHKHMLSGLLPYDKIEAAASTKGVRIMRAVYLRHRPALREPKAGLVQSEGDRAMGTDVVRRTYNVSGRPVDGRSLKCIGILSSVSVSAFAVEALRGSGDLPDKVRALTGFDLKSNFTSTSLQMMEVMFDVAPGLPEFAQFTAYGGQAAMVNGIKKLKEKAGCSIFVDDGRTFLTEPMFQDGRITQAVDSVTADGTAYIVAAGDANDNGLFERFNNSGIRERVRIKARRPDLYSRYAPRFDFANITYEWHRFELNGKIELPLKTLPYYGGRDCCPGPIVLNWDQPYFSVTGDRGATTDLDIIVMTKDGDVVGRSISNNVGGDPIEVTAGGGLIYMYRPGYDRLFLRVGKKVEGRSGNAPDPSHIGLLFGDDFTNVPAGPTIYGRAAAKGAIAVGSSFYKGTTRFGVDPPLIRSTSSRGVFPILLDTKGDRTEPKLRSTPAVVGPDGVSTNEVGYGGGFTGTASSASHVAALAALLRDFDRTLTPGQIRSILTRTARDMNDPETRGFDQGRDNKTGFGFVNAPRAFNELATRK